MVGSLRLTRLLALLIPVAATITAVVASASTRSVSDSSIVTHPHVSRDMLIVLIAVLALVGLMGYEAVKRWGSEAEAEEGEALLRGKAF